MNRNKTHLGCFELNKHSLRNVIVQGLFGYLGSSREGTSNGGAHYTLLSQPSVYIEIADFLLQFKEGCQSRIK